MSKKTLTQWFPADVKPVHVGVYEIASKHTIYPKDSWHSLWDGDKWHSPSCMGANDAFEFGESRIYRIQQMSWRGLAVKP